VFTRMCNILLGACFFYVVLVCLVPTTTWADFDKTIVDLQRGRPEAASRYYRPRAAQLYRWDKTEVDLGVPLPPPPVQEQRGSKYPSLLPGPVPAPPGGR